LFTYSWRTAVAKERKVEPMNKDQVEGVARNVGGKVQEAAGDIIGDAKIRAEGIANQAAGSAQEAVGEAKEAVADAYTQTEDAVREFIENRPYTTAAIALGIGWLLGKMGRSRY
jgi:uncharacterized protein YjbJ (UPF0337 family)